MTNKINAREVVLDMLLEIIEGEKFSHTVLNQNLKKYQQLTKQERAFINTICIGTVKRYLTIDFIINQFASVPVQKMKPFIRNLLRLSVYQMFFMDKVPVSAICNEAVKLAKKRGFTQLAGFVNGILRNIARNKATIVYPDKEKDPIGYLSIQYSTPRWIVKELINQYGFDPIEKLLEASMKEKELTIRCNRSKISPEDLKDRLEQEGVTVEISEYLDYGFKIKDFDYIEKLNAFQEGYFTIQDISSMLACQVAGIEEQDLVLDVCAAPGGKALHAAEKAKKVIARDLTEYKINLIDENIKRLNVSNVETGVWDARELDQDLVGKVDVVIADLPCSGLGVMGKKADIKYKLSHNQPDELVQLQRAILTTVKEYVKPGGILIFSTCTVNKKENIENLKWFLNEGYFLAENLNSYLPSTLQGDTTKEGYLQLIQGIHSTDGFFIAKLRKREL